MWERFFGTGVTVAVITTVALAIGAAVGSRMGVLPGVVAGLAVAVVGLLGKVVYDAYHLSTVENENVNWQEINKNKSVINNASQAQVSATKTAAVQPVVHNKALKNEAKKEDIQKTDAKIQAVQEEIEKLAENTDPSLSTQDKTAEALNEEAAKKKKTLEEQRRKKIEATKAKVKEKSAKKDEESKQKLQSDFFNSTAQPKTTEDIEIEEVEDFDDTNACN